MPIDPHEILTLMHYRREVEALYEQVRTRRSERPASWLYWATVRDRLFATHPQSPIPPSRRAAFDGLSYFAHDPAMTVTADLVRAASDDAIELAHSADGTTTAQRAGTLEFRLAGEDHQLPAYWLAQYGGGLFVPFRDRTSGSETYGGGRYVIDSAKGADLGTIEGKVVLDFNYSYHPSCVHDPRWSCPLAPPDSTLGVAIRAGERLPETIEQQG